MSYYDSGMANSALRKINRSWWWHTVCYSGILGFLIGALYYGANTGTIFSNKTDPFMSGPMPGLILFVLFFLASLPTYLKLLYRKFSLRPYFDNRGSSIVWSDEVKARSSNLLVFVFKVVVFIPVSVVLAPLVPIAVCPYKAKEISDYYGVKSFNYKLAITIWWIAVVAAFIGAVIVLISKKGMPVG